MAKSRVRRKPAYRMLYQADYQGKTKAAFHILDITRKKPCLKAGIGILTFT
jgi:hypothetical protein